MLQAARARRGNDSFTQLLLHCDGADASTSFADSSANAFTVTANGNAQIDTAQSKFGGASALFDGTGDYLSVADNAALEMGSGDFTIECFFRTTTVSGSHTILSKRASSAVAAPYEIFQSGTSLQWLATSSGGSAWDIALSVSIGTIAANTWYHVALSRQGTAFRSFLNGVAGTGATSSASLLDNAAALVIGGDTDTFGFNGWIDEVRLSKGIARYTGAFTPPALPFSRGGKASTPSFAMAA